MRIGLALRELHRSENALATELFHVSERHKTDHEIHHLARDWPAGPSGTWCWPMG